MNKNYFLAGLVVLLVIAGVFVWKAPGTAPSQTTIKVGVIGPFTGPVAEYGEAHRNGFMLAAKDFNASGKHIEFIYEDSQYDTAKAVSAFHKLTDIDKVNVVVDWGAATSYGVAPLAKSAGVPFIAISVDPDTVKASDYVFRDNPSPDDIANKLWNYFREKGYKNIALVNLKLLYFDKITASLTKLAQPGETVTVVDTYQSFSDSDFRTSIQKIKSAKKYDVLGVFLAGDQIVDFYQQAHALSLSMPTFGTDFFESPTLIKSANGLMDGAVYVLMGTSDEFDQKYKNAFGNDNQLSYAGLSYDLGRILITKTDFSSAQSVLASLQSIKDFPGTIGTYSYSDANGDRYLKPTLYVKQIEGSDIKVVE